MATGQRAPEYGGLLAAFATVFAPRVTRLIAAMMSVVAFSDFLQLAYKGAENRRDSDY